MVTYAEKPWVRHYTLGPFPLRKERGSYPELSVPDTLDNSAFNYPDRPAIFFLERVITYRELKIAVDKLATALADMGVKKGEKVATVLPNCPQSIISDYGIMKIGGVLIPCSIMHEARDLIYEIGQSEAKLVICQEGSLDLINSIKDKTKIEKVIVSHPLDYTPSPPEPREIPGAIGFRDLLENYKAEPPEVDIDPKEDLADVMFTGGTTGLAKGVMHTHYNRVTVYEQSIGWALEPIVSAVKGKSSLLLPLPLFHEGGRLPAQISIYLGIQIILLPDPRDADKLKETLERFRPFICSAVPTQFTRVLPKGLKRTHSMFMSGAQASAPEVVMEVERQTGMPVTEVYGLTECLTSHMNLSAFQKLTGFAPEIKRGSIGVPIIDTDAKIVDPDTGEEVPVGKEGEMYLRGPQVMKGYWPEPGLGLKEGWLPTGDIGRMEEDGYFYLTDRIKDIATVSGTTVYTRLVDDVIYELPGVGDAVVIGIPDPERPGSEMLKAFVRPKKGYEDKITAEEVIDHCRTKLPPYAVPKFVEFREELPLTLAEKLFKRALREEEIQKMRKAGSEGGV